MARNRAAISRGRLSQLLCHSGEQPV